MRHGLKGPRRGAWALLGALVGAVILGAVGGASVPSQAACPTPTPKPNPTIKVGDVKAGHSGSKGGTTGRRVEVTRGDGYLVADGSVQGGVQVWAGAQGHNPTAWAHVKPDRVPVAVCADADG